MDTVKAVINLKDGVLEFEGPQEFVEKYLKLYLPDVSKWQTALLKKGEVETKEKGPKQTRAAKPKGVSSCMGRIRNLIDENYFKDPKTSTEVKDWLEEQKGVTYMSGPISGALNKLVQSGKLRRFRESKKEPYKYCNP
jgi:hypothetical protein